MNIAENTRLQDLLQTYPWLLDEAAKIDEKFKLLKTPMGKLMLKKATVAEMSRRSGIEISELMEKLDEMIRTHDGGEG